MIQDRLGVIKREVAAAAAAATAAAATKDHPDKIRQILRTPMLLAHHWVDAHDQTVKVVSTNRFDSSIAHCLRMAYLIATTL